MTSSLTSRTNGFTFQPGTEISMSLIKWTPITIKPPAKSPRLRAPEHRYLSRTCTVYSLRFHIEAHKKPRFVSMRSNENADDINCYHAGGGEYGHGSNPNNQLR